MSAVIENEAVEQKELSAFNADMFWFDVAPIKVSSNAKEMIAIGKKFIESRNVVVTAESAKRDKSLPAELNKAEKMIQSKLKEAKPEAIKEWLEFETLVKTELCEPLKKAAKDITEQIRKFEEETLAEVRKLLIQEREAEWERCLVETEFRKAVIEDLLSINGLTPKGVLVKGLKTSVAERVQADLGLQNKINGRIMMTENKSLRAEINPPLVRANVEHFLFHDDFETKLEALIAAEVIRKEETEERLRKKLEAEKKREMEVLAAQQAESDRVAKAKADAEAINQWVEEQANDIKQQAEKESASNPTNQTEALQAQLNQLSEAHARFPDQGTQQAISNVRSKIAQNAAVPKASFTMKAIVEFTIEARTDADQAKMKEHFTNTLYNSLLAENKKVTMISLVKS